jgi:hypothetical protein
MEALIVLVVVVVAGWAVLRICGGAVATAQQEGEVERRKDELMEKAIRDAFIAAPLEIHQEEFMDRIMENLASIGRLRDRKTLREALRDIAGEQITPYLRLAENTAEKVYCALSPAERKTMTISTLRKRISRSLDGPTIDSLADRRDEQIDDIRGLRRAITATAMATFDESPADDDEDDEEPVVGSDGLAFSPCPSCGLLFRDMSRSDCRGCGHEFDQRGMTDRGVAKGRK